MNTTAVTIAKIMNSSLCFSFSSLTKIDGPKPSQFFSMLHTPLSEFSFIYFSTIGLYGARFVTLIYNGDFFRFWDLYTSSKERGRGLNAIFDSQTENFLSQRVQSTNSTETEFC